MHAERTVALPILPVRLSVCPMMSTVSKQMDISSHFSYSGKALYNLSSPAAVTKFQGNPRLAALNTMSRLFCKHRHLGNSTRWGNSYYGTLVGSHIGSRSIRVGSNDLE